MRAVPSLIDGHRLPFARAREGLVASSHRRAALRNLIPCPIRREFRSEIIKATCITPLYFTKAFCYISVMEVTYTRTAIKALRKLPPRDSKAIMAKITDYAAGGQQDVKALRNSEYFRLRHGNWRAIFSLDGVVLAVLNVAKRGEVYR